MFLNAFLKRQVLSGNRPLHGQKLRKWF